MSSFSSSFFANVPLEPPNPILGVSRLCNQDSSPEKIDLVIGAYRDEHGKPKVLDCVREAEDIVHAKKFDHEYLGQDGLPEFVSSSQVLLFGEGAKVLKDGLVFSIQSLSGTGSLRLGADLLAAHFKGRVCYIPSTTWGNHPVLFSSAGVPHKTYRYLDGSGCALDFAGLIEDFGAMPEGSVVLLHNCAHNPTGVDPTEDQWREILRVMQERKLFPYFDNAYQGFVSGCPATDAFSVRMFADAGVEMLVACSFAKNFGLYGERVGVLHVVTAHIDALPLVSSQLRALSRALYSTCPTYGARIVATILSDPARRAAWEAQCKGMADRLNAVRRRLFDELVAQNVKGTWQHVITQRGMFSYTGISAAAVDRLQKEYHIYMLGNGRISLAGLNDSNISRFVSALAVILGTN